MFIINVYTISYYIINNILLFNLFDIKQRDEVKEQLDKLNKDREIYSFIVNKLKGIGGSNDKANKNIYIH